jgi:phosphatidylglycerophosphate synthase
MPQFETPQFESGTRPINATQTATGEVMVKVPDVGPVIVREAQGTQNWKTISFNIGIAIILAVLTLMTTIDWTKWIDPTLALFVVTIANAVLRAISAMTGGGPAGSNVVVQKLN